MTLPIMVDSIGAGVRFTLVQNSTAFIAPTVTVLSFDDHAIHIAGSSVLLNVQGTVFGQNGIGTRSQTPLHTLFIDVGAQGRVIGEVAGITGQGDEVIVRNHGMISGRSIGVSLYGDHNRVINDGVIEGALCAIQCSTVSGTYDAAATVENHGTIRSVRGAYSGDNTANDELSNYGSISGEISLYGGNDHLFNRGTIVGSVSAGAGNDDVRNVTGGVIDGKVDLGSGNDTYDGRGGEAWGVVSGGLGDDYFLGNAAHGEAFDGGVGSDLLDFSGGAAVTVALDHSFANMGAARGDTYSNFERVIGSESGDVIRGSAAANVLAGRGGADRVDGATGDDTITGGAGHDTLTGGLGNDVFRFTALSDFGDVITDFGNVSGNNDVFQLTAAALGGGLGAGALAPDRFLSRTDNHAHDANDRFIFRTTDTTLWFDADGTGAGAAVLVADLQARVVLSVADIALI